MRFCVSVRDLCVVSLHLAESVFVLAATEDLILFLFCLIFSNPLLVMPGNNPCSSRDIEGYQGVPQELPCFGTSGG
jgi:hypothetical protein